MAQQIIRCYSPPIKQRFDTRHRNAAWWVGVTWDSRPYEEVFSAGETADATERLSELDESKVYVIGGIVDKMGTSESAIKQVIPTAQLPIGDYIKMASRKILTMNHVFEILLKYMEYRDWQRAFLEVILQRKFKENQGRGRKRRNGKGDKSEEGDGEGGESADEERDEERDEEGDEEGDGDGDEEDEEDEENGKDEDKEGEKGEDEAEKGQILGREGH